MQQVVQYGRSMPRQGASGDACMILIFPITQLDVEYRFGSPGASKGAFENYALVIAFQSEKDTIYMRVFICRSNIFCNSVILPGNMRHIEVFYWTMFAVTEILGDVRML
jgi:hypothetical protein